jgi:hypothetical protein
LKDHRLGKFIVSNDMVEDEPDMVRMLFHNVIPLRVEQLYYRAGLEVVGLHPDFAEVSRGVPPPEYEGVFENGRRRWRRLDGVTR